MKIIMKKSHSNSGFTLLEIIIAITILSFLMLGVYYLTSNSTESATRVTKEDLFKVQIEAAMNRMDQDFSRIYTPLYYKPRAKKKESQSSTFNSPATEEEPSFEVTDRFPEVTKDNLPIPVIKSDSPQDLLFFSTINQKKIQNAKEAHFVWIKYQIRDVQSENKRSEAPLELVRYYMPSDIYASDFNFDNIRPSVVLSNIKSFEFKFWNQDKKKFVDNLLSMDNKYLLRAIKVVLTLVDHNKIEYKFERTFRCLWPYFVPDPNEDAPEKKKSTPPGGNPFSNNADNIDSEDGEDGDDE